MFEQIDAEITDQRSEPAAAPMAAPTNPAAVADQIRRELALIELRRNRTFAD
jgi:hypothetical protein